MIKKFKSASFLVLSFAMLQAQAAYSATVLEYAKKQISTGGWLTALITAGFAVLALIQVIERWAAIFEGNAIFKNVSVIGSLIGLAVWWKDIVLFLLEIGS